VLGKVIGGWQAGWILTMQSGAPLSLSAVGAFNTTGNNTPVPLAPLAGDIGSTQKTGNGVVYFQGLGQIVDPYVSQITTLQGIQQKSSMLAVTDASGKPILVNPQPGQLGMRTNFLAGPGLFQLDLNLLKRVKITERCEFYIRADATNASNRANFSNPDANINSTTFGRITGTSTDPRIIVLSGRLNF
jgi:hypothetical protein